MPSTPGKGWRACSALPALIFVSSGLTPLAWMRTSTSPARGVGLATVDETNAAFGAVNTMARMVAVGWFDMAVLGEVIGKSSFLHSFLNVNSQC